MKRLDTPSFTIVLPINLILLYFFATKFIPYLDNQLPDANIAIGFISLMTLIITPFYMFFFVLWVLLMRQKLMEVVKKWH